MPAASTRMSTSPAPATGVARSVSCSMSGPPGRWISIAFIAALAAWERGAHGAPSFTTPAALLLLLRGCRCRALAGHGLHRQANTALLVGLDHLDLHRLAFLQVVGDGVDALVGDLRNMQQPIATRQDLHDRAEVEQAQHRAVIDLADLDLGRQFHDPALGFPALLLVDAGDDHRAV